MTFLDFFAGVGGFRRGMELAGHTCVGFCEFDKFAVASYTSMHLITEEQREYLATLDLKKRQKEILKGEYRNGEWYADDIRTVYAGDIPKADCWCFGFPCQDISVAGKQVGFYGNRSSLFFRVMYLLGQQDEEKKPTYLFIENVKNLLSVNGGWDFARLLTEMDKGGYDAEWQVLNSKYFGVPQNRERCFIIGHLRGRSGPEIFPIEGTDGEDSVCGIIAHRNGYRRNTQVFDPEGVTETLDTGAGGGRGHYTVEIINKDYKHQHEAVKNPGGIVGTLLARDYKDHQRVAIPVLTPDRVAKRQNGRRFKEDGEESFTLTSQDRHGVAIDVKPEVIGGIGEKNFGKQFREGNRVYESDKVATALKASNVGNAGGSTNLYSVDVDPFAIGVAERVRDDGMRLDPNNENISNALTSNMNHSLVGVVVQLSNKLTVYAVWYPKKQCYIAIRKLTPRECFRLQGWSDDYFERAEFVNSNSQLYKQAGNGVTVTVIKAIADRMREDKDE